MKIQSVKDLEKITQEHSGYMYHPDSVKVNIGMASCGIAAGAQAAFETATQAFAENKAVNIAQTGCIGYCEMEPLVEIFSGGTPLSRPASPSWGVKIKAGRLLDRLNL